MKRVKQLDKNLINQIAAGEVIERPASVVKELVENSIDAGATKIEITVSNEARNIRVADNGSGIHPDDVELAFSKHSTSKISTKDDLFNISTFGFRGEALASLISVAKLTCITRTKDYDYGFKLTAKNSEVKKSETGCEIGTIMEVEDLFYNTPVRLKFLKNFKTEYNYITEMVQAIALANPQVSICLKNVDNITLQTNGSGDLFTTISELYSNDFLTDLEEINRTDILSGLKITGYASTPNYTRSNKKSIYTFVNNRVVKCSAIIKATDIAYKNLLSQGRYPFVIINLTIPNEDVDVNVHPTKKEVRYKNPNQIFNFVRTSIDEAISSIPTGNFSNEQYNGNIVSFTDFTNNNSEKNSDDFYVSDAKDFNLNQINKPTTEQVMDLYKPVEQISFNIETADISENVENPEKIIGQYKNTYILIETEDGLEIVDQHIADERYLWEKINNEREISSQLLLISDLIDIEPDDIQILKNNKENLKKFGYSFNFISDNQIAIKEIPSYLSHIKPEEILFNLLENLKNNTRSIEENLLMSIACKGAVKAGETLSSWQMQEIIKKWRTTKNPHTCPHGRPISHIIKHKDIAQFFMRNK